MWLLIIAILVGLLLPIVTQAKQEAGIARCTANLKQIGTALSIYVGHYVIFTPTGEEGGIKSQSTYKHAAKFDWKRHNGTDAFFLSIFGIL